MSFKFGIGFAQGTNVAQVAREAALLSKTSLGSDRVDLALVFSTVHYDPTIFLPVVYSTLEQARLIGCTTAGLIFQHSIHTHGIGVLTLSSSDITFGIGDVQNIAPDNLTIAGAELAKNCMQDFGQTHRNASLFLTDGNLENNSLLLKGIQSVLGNIFPIIGGGSSDDFKFKSTYQFINNQVITRSAVGIIFGGPQLSVGIGARHGWRPLGKPRFVTNANGNTIRTIDHRPALALYSEFFGDDAQKVQTNRLGQMSVLYPLGIYVTGSEEYLIRNTSAILEDGSIKCQGEVLPGTEIHVMIGNKESCKEAVTEAAKEAQIGLQGKKAKLVVVIESMARLKLLGRSAKEELNNLNEVFGHDTPIFGFYSNGEISPFQSMENIKQPYIQNESIVILAMG